MASSSGPRKPPRPSCLPAGLRARRRREPGEGPVDRLIAAERETEALTEAECIHNVMLIFVAGHETTTNPIGNGVFSLLQHPAELARLRRDPSSTSPAIPIRTRASAAACTTASARRSRASRARVAFAKLLERYRHLELNPDRLTWVNRINLRGLSELGLRVGR